MAVIYKTHYAYLEANFRVMMEALKKDIPELQWVAGEDNIIADGDKCYQYIGDMELRSKVDLHPFQIAFVYLLSYYYPFSQELRQTATGWVRIGRINALFTQVQQLWTAVDSFDTPAMQPNPADGEPATLKIYPPLSH